MCCVWLLLCLGLCGDGDGAENFAIALALMEDRRCLSCLEAIASSPGGVADPVGHMIYPNRMKALPFLGRFKDVAAVPALEAIVKDGAKAFTADVVTTGVFTSLEECRK